MKRKPLGIIILVVAEAVLAITSIAGGRILLADPLGNTLGLQPLIPYLPFNLHDYTLVGVWLIVSFGLLPLILAAGFWFRKTWAWWMGLSLGAALIIWVIAEVLMFFSFGFTFFYPLIAGIGLITIVVLYLPSTRLYFFAKAVVER